VSFEEKTTELVHSKKWKWVHEREGTRTKSISGSGSVVVGSWQEDLLEEKKKAYEYGW